jgi:hypothetical protein
MQLYTLQNALHKQVEIRLLDSYGNVGLIPGTIIAVNAKNGTIDVQTADGLVRTVKRYWWETKKLRMTWQWPGAPDPEDPDRFVPDPPRKSRWKNRDKFGRGDPTDPRPLGPPPKRAA